MTKPVLLAATVLIAVLALSGSARAAPCGNQLIDSEVTAPGGALDHEPYIYVAGAYVDLHLTISKCSRLRGVRWNSQAIGTGGPSIDPVDASYEILVNSDSADGNRNLTVRIYFQNGGLGRVNSLELDLGTVRRWSIVGVASVGGNLTYTVAREEIYNAIVAGIWDEFRGRAKWDGVLRIHDPSYEPVITFDATGIRMQWSVWAQPEVAGVPLWCDTLARIDTHFNVYIGSDNKPVVENATYDVDLSSGACDLTAIVPILNGVVEVTMFLIEEHLEGIVEERVGDAVTAAASFCQGAMCHALGVELVWSADRLDLVVANYNPPRISVKVPYDSLALTDLWRGVPVRSQDSVIISGTGVVELCELGWDSSLGTCARTRSGVSGLYNAGEGWGLGSNVPGIAASLPLGGYDVAGVLVAGLKTADRQLTGVPFPDDNIGALMVNAGGTVKLAARPCALPLGITQVGFGVNDTRRSNYAPYGTGAYEVSLTFAGGEHGLMPQCAGRRKHLAGIVQARWAQLASELGILGWPTTDLQTIAGGWFAEFENGASIYHQAGTWQAFVVWGAIRGKWHSMGGTAGWGAGWPVSEELVTIRNGRVSHFQHGSVYVHPDADGGRPHAVINGIRDVYRALEAEQGVLGFPITDELPAARPGAVRSRFERGTIYWSNATGTVSVRQPVHHLYTAYGEEGGYLGLPKSEQRREGPWMVQQFEFSDLWVWVG